ncbi:choice-of-anchor G family protein [Clavibacter nebraskensis]|uniref:choice-of-anchor G family protein n=1 Tax=Clavibacter nebraskensis TaxID=31963 RepID=UPI003F84A415
MPRRRGSLATATAFGLAAAIVAFGGTAPANAAPGDTAEAEGRFLTLTGVPQVIAVDGAYTSYGPGDTAAQVESAPLDATVLGGLANAQLAAGVTLGSLLDLDQAAAAGVLQQYASSGPAGATGAAGAVSDSGAIQVGQGSGQQTVVDLGSTIASIGAQGALSDLSLRLGAISSTITSTGTGTPASDYDIASAEAVITSPLVAEISTRLSAAVDGIAPDIAGAVDVSAATGPLLQGILGENVLTRTLRVGTPTVVATADVDTAAVVQSALAEPLTNADGTVSIDVSAGTITVDLDRIQALDDRAPGTSVLTSAILSSVVDSAITDIFTDVLPNRLVTALRASTTVDVAVTAPLTTALGLDAGTLGVDVSLSLDRLLGGTTGTAPTISLARTALLPPLNATVDLTALAPLFDDLVTALLGSNADTSLLPAVGDALAGVGTGVITALAPAFAVVDRVVRLTVNEQTPDAFVDPDGVDAGSSSVTALRITLLGDGPTIDLARSTVRAVPAPAADAVTIASPTPAQVIELPAGQTTAVVPVTGTADADAEVTLTVGGQTVGPVEVGADGEYAFTPPALPAGTYTAVVTQTIGGQAAGSATVTFTIAAAVADITITTPTADQLFLTTAADPTADVPVEGTADVRATVAVTIPGQPTQTEQVGADGRYDVAFADLPVGTYTATATQTVDGVVRGTETVTFTVGAPAAVVTITSPTDGDEILSAGTVPTADVPVTGTADPRATVTVTIPGQAPQTEVVGADGLYDVVFPDLPVGAYTATATQAIGGIPAGTATVDFTVGAPAAAVVIDTPTDGQDFAVPAGGNAVDVTVTGSADPRGSVLIAVTGRTPVTQVVGADGRFEATFPGLTAAGYTVTVTQTVDDAPAGSDTADFTVSIAGVDQVVIATPDDGAFLPIPAGGTTLVVPVTGTADPDATVTLTVGGTTTDPVAVGDDGDFTLATPALPSGTYTGTVTQTIGGVAVGTDTVTFTIGDPVVIDSPSDAQVLPLTGGATTRDVPISGTADPRGTVTVSIPGFDPITTEVDDVGNYSVTFLGLGRGSYTATASQTIGGAPAGDASVDFEVGVDGEEGTDSDATAAIDVDGDGTDVDGGTDAADAVDADATDVDAADAAGTDATDAAGTDAADADAAGTDAADAAGADAADAAGADATDADGTDATDAAGADAADAAGTDATDAAGTDAADSAGTDATDAAGTDATDAAGTDATDAAGTDAADAAGTDATDAAGTDATDAAGTDATDAAGTDATDSAGTDATDAAGTDAADAAGTDATDAAGADATDAAGADAADATDAADGSTDGADAPTRAVVRFTELVRGSGTMQMVDAVGFIPGETLDATVFSTPKPLAPMVADAQGRATFVFEVGPDFELGDHRVDVIGSQSGMADVMITRFRVLGSTVPAGQPGTPIRGGGYGGGFLPVTGGDGDGMLLLGGIALLMMLTGAGALHRGRSRRA